MPDTLADLHAYRREMLEGDTLHVTDWARRRARKIVLEPPVPWMARPLLETANFITIALLPDRLRDEYGFAPLPPAPIRKAHRGGRSRVREARGGAVPAGAPAAGAGGARCVKSARPMSLDRGAGLMKQTTGRQEEGDLSMTRLLTRLPTSPTAAAAAWSWAGLSPRS